MSERSPRHKIEKKLSEHVRNSNPLTTRAAIFKTPPDVFEGKTTFSDDIPPNEGRSRALRSHYQKHLNDVDGMIKATDNIPNNDSQIESKQSTTNTESTVLSSIQQFNFFSYFLPTIDSSLPSEQLTVQNTPNSPAVTMLTSPSYIAPSTLSSVQPVDNIVPNHKVKQNLPPTPPIRPGLDKSPAITTRSLSIPNDDLSWIPKLNHAQRMTPIEKKKKFLAAQNHVNHTVRNSENDQSSESDKKMAKSVTINLTPMKPYNEGGGLYGEPVMISPGRILDVNDLLHQTIHSADHDDIDAVDDNQDGNDEDDNTIFDVDFAMGVISDKRGNLRSKSRATAAERRAIAIVDRNSPGPVSSLIEHFESNTISSLFTLPVDPNSQFSAGSHSWSLIPKSYEVGGQLNPASSIDEPISKTFPQPSTYPHPLFQKNHSVDSARIELLESATEQLELMMEYITGPAQDVKGLMQPPKESNTKNNDSIRLYRDLHKTLTELHHSLAPGITDNQADHSGDDTSNMNDPSSPFSSPCISGNASPPPPTFVKTFTESVGLQTSLETQRIIASVAVQTHDDTNRASSSMQTEDVPILSVTSASVQTDVTQEVESEHEVRAELLESARAEIRTEMEQELHSIRAANEQYLQLAAQDLAGVTDELILAKAAAAHASQEAAELRDRMRHYKMSATKCAADALNRTATLKQLQFQIIAFSQANTSENAVLEKQIASLQLSHSVATAELSKHMTEKEMELAEVLARASDAVARADKAEKEINVLVLNQAEMEKLLLESRIALETVARSKAIIASVAVQTHDDTNRASSSMQTEDVPILSVTSASVQTDVTQEVESEHEVRAELLKTERALFETDLRLEETLLEAEKQRLQSILEIAKMKRKFAEDKFSMEQLASDLDSTFETLALTLVELSMERETP